MNKIAYLIGINNYLEWSCLKNTLNDLVAMEEVLTNCGFIVKKYENPNSKKLEDIVKSYPYDLLDASEGLFYYSGHGIEVNGKQYLIASDSKSIPATKEVDYEILRTCIDITSIINREPLVEGFVSLYILDCCRENCKLTEVDIGRGSSAETLFSGNKGTFISFSTGSNSIASDGADSNGLFTKHLVQKLKSEIMPVEILFKEVRKEVINDSKNRQVPWEHSSLIGDYSINKDLFQPILSTDLEQIVTKVFSEKLSGNDLINRLRDIYNDILNGKIIIDKSESFKSETDFQKYCIKSIDELYLSEMEE